MIKTQDELATACSFSWVGGVTLIPASVSIVSVAPVSRTQATSIQVEDVDFGAFPLNHIIPTDRFRADARRGDPMNTAALTSSAFKSPAILLSGSVDYVMYRDFRSQLDQAAEQNLVVIELSTLGGDPEVARMMGEDIRFHSQVSPERRFVFLGKAMIYSAGTTFMSFFARGNRYLTPNTRLMIHERKLSKELMLDGPLTTCIATVKAALNEIECSIEMQNEGFASLVRGSSVSMNEVLRRAPSNWYIAAEEAKELGLIEDVI